MIRAILISAFAALLCLAATRLSAQDVYSNIATAYIQSCNCMVADFDFSWDYIAAEDYNINVSGQFSDTDNTFSQGFDYCDQGVTGCDVEIQSSAGPPLGDTYQASGDITGSLDGRPPEYACTEGMGNQFAQSGCGCACYGVDALCDFISDPGESDASSPSCGKGADLDTLMNEYLLPNMPPWYMPSSTASAWRPDCLSFVQSGLTGYSNADAFSPSDITDWRVYQQAFADGLEEINASSRPSYVTGVPSEPIPVAGTGDIYRTPYHEYTLDYASHPSEPHQFGLAIDFGAGNQAIYDDIAAWAEVASGSSPGKINGDVCVEPTSLQGNYGHVHVDWRPEVYSPCPNNSQYTWTTDYISVVGWP